jgi:tetratricopeptide (TPR) repeat protein
MRYAHVWSPLLLALALAGRLAAADAHPDPLPALPPEPRTLHLAPGTLTHGQDERPIDRAGLARDIEALTRTVQHVEASLGEAATVTHDEAEGADAHPPITTATPAAVSERFGATLTARGTGSEALVTADISGEPVDVLLREVAKLVAIPLEDDRVPGLRRTMALRVKELPASEVFDRLLGQVGVAWRLEGHAAAQRMVLTNAPSDEDIDAAAERALMRAQKNAAAANDPAAEAEARYLLAKRALDRQQPVEAMRRFNELVQAMSQTRDKDALKWVQRGVRGIGDSMSALRQWGDARSVYRNFIGRAAPDDPDLPAVYLASAEAGRRRGLETADPLAFDEAAEDLHAMLEKYGEDKRRPEVPAARLMIGGLLYDAHRWGEAETQLKRWVAEAGGHTTDLIAGQLADCAFELGRYDEARAGFEELFRHFRAEQTTAPKAVYERAAYRIGLCHLREAQPRFVHALFAFQRAQTAFPKTQLTAELLLNIARCYAEIEREDEAVAALWDMLHQDPGTQPVGSDAQAHLDAELGGLLGRLSEYPGPVRAKAMFYIAQAEHRRAERDRASRAVVAAQAIGYYERVLSENPSPELQDAARIGLARACFLAGNDERGQLELTNALKDPGLGARDRAYAARLLGDHLRAQGHPREAIKAYQGIVE